LIIPTYGINNINDLEKTLDYIINEIYLSNNNKLINLFATDVKFYISNIYVSLRIKNYSCSEYLIKHMMIYVNKKDYLSEIRKYKNINDYLFGLNNVKNKEMYNLCIEMIEFGYE
jgi:hypothetical protein